MSDKRRQNRHYLDDITSYNRLTWVGAVAAALGLNLLLFLLMPRLMHQSPALPTIEKIVPNVQVTRLHRPEQEKKREIKPPEPPPPPPETNARSAPDRPAKPELKMPFEINPRLPSGPNTLNLPPLKTGPMMPGNVNIFSEGELDAPLTVLVRIPPVYPLRARRLGIEGWVKVSFFVNKSGKVENIRILEADPENVFDSSVRQCVSRWRFKPGTIDGTPVTARMITTIKFKLE